VVNPPDLRADLQGPCPVFQTIDFLRRKCNSAAQKMTNLPPLSARIQHDFCRPLDFPEDSTGKPIRERRCPRAALPEAGYPTSRPLSARAAPLCPAA